MKKTSRGFTVIEMVVVIAVFLFVVGAGLGIFISLVQNQKKVLAQQQILNQISYIEERMSKALRMAKKADTAIASERDCMGGIGGFVYLLTRYNASSGTYGGIKFLNQSFLDDAGYPVCQEFYFDGAANVMKEYNTKMGTASLTSKDDIHIKNVKFAINGSNGGHLENSLSCTSEVCGASDKDLRQPRVTILMNVFLPSSAGESCSDDSQCSDKPSLGCDKIIGKCQPVQVFQTTISQRNINTK